MTKKQALAQIAKLKKTQKVFTFSEAMYWIDQWMLLAKKFARSLPEDK